MADHSVSGHLQPAQTVEITDTTEIIHIGEDELKAAKEKLEAHVKEIKLKIHRFPAKLRGFGRDMDYIAPSIVAIGPYYHGVPELQAMEEVKRMAVYYFCEGLADSPEEVYKKIVPVARDVRGCYADADALEGITDDDFAAMMFFDGCFLVQCMVSLFSGEQSPFTSVISSKGRGSILRDMMLLENQIPWRVLQLLTDLRPVPMAHFIYKMILGFRVSWSREEQDVIIDEDFEPPHLLGLIHFHQVCPSSVKKESRLYKIYRKLFCSKWGLSRKSVHEESSPEESVPEELVPEAKIAFFKKQKEKGVDKLTVTTSAAELAEIGVKLKPSGTMQFSDMKVVRGLLCATLSLAPLLLSDVNACWLVNMAAFEQCTGGLGKPYYSVNSYLSIMAQLMNRDDDVRALHGKHILHTIIDYDRTLKFFKHLALYLTADSSFLDMLEGLQAYKQKRWVRIAIYKFIYNNAKTIATVLSIIGVLVGIFKTLISLKQHQP